MKGRSHELAAHNVARLGLPTPPPPPAGLAPWTGGLGPLLPFFWALLVSEKSLGCRPQRLQGLARQMTQ